MRRGPDQPGGAREGSYLDALDPDQEIGFADALAWLSKRRVGLTAVAMIALELVWKAGFLGHFYFRQDDIHFTEIALRSPLDWKYLTYVGSGHLHPGVLLIVWILARVALYNWGAASAVLLVMLAVASFAAWWLLRTLIGNRPALLIPLALYLFTPLTFANDSWWQSGIESAPLQAVIFLSLIAHVHYVRSGRVRHLAAAAVCLAVGLFFFEKAAVIPVLLFGVTAGFLLEGGLAVTVRQSLARYWRAWLLYVGMVAVYVAVLLISLRSSTVKPAPASLSTGLSFSANLIKDTLLPGLLGGPWQWYFSPNNAIAYSAPSSALTWLSLLVTAAIVVTSVMVRARAWRAWAILATWIVLADIGPVFLGRLSSFGRFSWLLELDTRYVADAAPVAAICVALAFWPVVQSQQEDSKRARRRQHEYFTSQTWRVVGLGLTAVLVVGSVVSVQAYEKVTNTTNFYGRTYLHNAQAALSVDYPRGTVIFNEAVPDFIMQAVFYDNDALESAALGPMASAAASRNLRWTPHPEGTIDNLGMFSGSGTLTRAYVRGARSATLSPPNGCWPFHQGKAVIKFTAPAPVTTGLLRIGYLSYASETASISYGGVVRQFVVDVGLNSVYVPVTGSAGSVTVLAPESFCIGDAEAGNLAPSAYPLTTQAHTK